MTYTSYQMPELWKNAINMLLNHQPCVHLNTSCMRAIEIYVSVLHVLQYSNLIMEVPYTLKESSLEVSPDQIS